MQLLNGCLLLRQAQAPCRIHLRDAAQRPLFTRPGAVSDVDDVLWPHRLGDVVVSAEPHGLLGAVHGRVAGDDHHLAIRPFLLDGAQYRKAVLAGHAQIEQHDVEGVRSIAASASSPSLAAATSQEMLPSDRR